MNSIFAKGAAQRIDSIRFSDRPTTVIEVEAKLHAAATARAVAPAPMI